VEELAEYLETFEAMGMVPTTDDLEAAGFSEEVYNRYLAEQRSPLEYTGVTVFNKPVFTDDETGEQYSERTETMPIGVSYMASPTIDPTTGDAYDEETLRAFYREYGPIDPYTNDKLPTFDTEEEAEEYARYRSENQFNPALLDENYYSPLDGSEAPQDARGTAVDVYNPTLRERSRNTLSDFLRDTLGFNQQYANRTAERFLGVENPTDGGMGLGLADLTPAGLIYGGQEAKRDFRRAQNADDKVGMALAGAEGALTIAEALPLTGVAAKLAGKGIKNLAEAVGSIEYDPSTVGMNFGNVKFNKQNLQETELSNEALDYLNLDVQEALNDVVPGTPPKKTRTAYRMYEAVPGTGPNFSPDWAKPGYNGPPMKGRSLFVNKQDHFEEGQWYDARMGDEDPKNPGQIKATLSGGVAPRGGFHSTTEPVSVHIGGKATRDAKKVNYRKANQVWAEVEIPDDVPWQKEADLRDSRDIPERIPVGGSYEFKTNPQQDKPWLIHGSVKINKFLSPEEAKAKALELGGEDLPLLPELIDRDNLSLEDLTGAAQQELKRYYPNKYEEMLNPSPTDAQMTDILGLRAEQMKLEPSERIQPSGSNPLFDLSNESYERTLPEQKEIYVPRPPEGSNRPLPKNDRGRAVQERSDKIAERLAERMKPWLGTEAQYFYHTGPIVEKALNMGYSKEQVYDWLREFADAYAATSPRTETAQNIRNATLAMAKRQMGLDMRDVVGPGGEGLNEKGYPMMIGLKGEIGESGKPNVSEGIHKKLLDAVQKGEGINPDTNTKPYTFAENVYGNLQGVTVDTHAIRGALDVMNEIEPGSIPLDYIKKDFRDAYAADPSSFDPATMVEDTLGKQTFNKVSMQTEYAVFSDIYVKAADILGVSPAEAQAMGWFGSGDSTGLASELKSVARLLDERIDVTAQATGMDKETVFRKLLSREIPVMSLFGGATGIGAAGLMSNEDGI